MAYNDEALKTKLSTLNETQDSIVSVSQWITFHKRHADRISSYWLTRLRDAPPPKRLNFIYLVNDIVQNARARKRPEFPDAFAPLMPEAIATAYRSSTPEIQNKIRRVTEVWKTRSVWEAGIQAAIEARLDDIDKTKSSSGKKTLGGSLFNSSSTAGNGGGSGVPTELSTLLPIQIAVTKAMLASNPAVATAQSEHSKLNSVDTVLPSPPVHAARLSSLIKSLTSAESSVSASIKARQDLIADLERILSINKQVLEKDESTLADLAEKRAETETKKRDVEDGIMRGLADDQASVNEFDTGNLGSGRGDGGGGGGGGGSRSHRPEVEELTPEPDDEFTPPEAVIDDPSYSMTHNAVTRQSSFNNPQLSGLLAGFTSGSGLSGMEGGNTMAGRVRQASSDIGGNNYGSDANGFAVKRRKTSHGIEGTTVPDLGEMGMDMNEFGLSGSGIDTNMGSTGYNVLDSLEGDVDELIRSQGGSGI